MISWTKVDFELSLVIPKNAFLYFQTWRAGSYMSNKERSRRDERESSNLRTDSFQIPDGKQNGAVHSPFEILLDLSWS